jgi:hypothetical protein
VAFFLKKVLLIILCCVVGAVVAAYVFALFFVGSFVTRAVNRYGPQLTGSAVKLTAAHISPFSGQGTLDDLTVGNPPGWSSNNAFSLKKIHVSVVSSSIFSDYIVINDLEIDDPEFLYETRLVSSNIGDLLNNIRGRKDQSETQAKTKTGSTVKFEVKHLLVRGGKITLSAGGQRVPLSLPPIEMNDIGANGGVTSSELAAQVTSELLKHVAQTAIQALGKLGGGAGGAASDVLKNAGGILKGVFGH